MKSSCTSDSVRKTNTSLSLAMLAACLATASVTAQAEVSVRLVADINPGASSSFPSNLTASANLLLFSATTTEVGRELWRYDGTGVTLVSNINDTTILVGGNLVGSDSLPAGMTEFNGGIFFSAYDMRRGGELWRTDGTNAARVADINPDANDTIKTNALSSWPRELTVLSNTLYFSADGGGLRLNHELWQCNGFTATRVANIHPDTGTNYSSYPQGLTVFNGVLYFMADDGTNGFELWKHGGGTTKLLANINPGGTTSSSYPKSFTQFNNALYFPAFHSSYGYELWKTDGTNASLVADLNAGAASSFPDYLTVFQGSLYFRANNGASGYELWRYNGTNATLAADVFGGGNAYPKNLTVFQDKLYFSATDGIYGWELWAYDGTAAALVTDLNPGGDSYPEQLKVFDGALYFVATTFETGYELWRFDGTSVALTADIQPGPANSYPQNLTVFNRELCFRAIASGGTDWELWSLTSSVGSSFGVSPDGGLSSSGTTGGPFAPPSVAYALTNSGSEPLSWTASASTSWINLSATEGTLAPGATATVIVSINAAADSLSAGTYLGEVSFASAAAGQEALIRNVSLTVNPILLSLIADRFDPMRLQLTLTGTPYQEYAVEAANDLQQWLPFATNATSADGTVILPITASTQMPVRFFRARPNR
jgi:ELWxxDGT repeat protein